MKKTTPFLLFVLAAFALGATEPSLEIVATSTNLVVTEQVQVSLVLKLPPVPGAYADAQPPFLNQRAPHVTCSFLEGEWKSEALDRGDPRVPLAPDQMPRRGGRSGPAFTLNNYVTDSISAMMDDPFDMFDGMDPFGRLGPKRQLFPFKVGREADKGWRLEIAVAPWRATAPGTVRLDPVTVEVPLITGVRRGRDRFNRAVDAPVFSNVVLRTKPLTLTVAEPPAAGRPASWCGAIASNLTVSATLDAKVCTAGDPLTFTLEIAGREPVVRLSPGLLLRVHRLDLPSRHRLVEDRDVERLPSVLLAHTLCQGRHGGVPAPVRFLLRSRPPRLRDAHDGIHSRPGEGGPAGGAHGR